MHVLFNKKLLKKKTRLGWKDRVGGREGGSHLCSAFSHSLPSWSGVTISIDQETEALKSAMTCPSSWREPWNLALNPILALEPLGSSLKIRVSLFSFLYF